MLGGKQSLRHGYNGHFGTNQDDDFSRNVQKFVMEHGGNQLFVVKASKKGKKKGAA